MAEKLVKANRLLFFLGIFLVHMQSCNHATLHRINQCGSIEFISHDVNFWNYSIWFAQYLQNIAFFQPMNTYSSERVECIASNCTTLEQCARTSLLKERAVQNSHRKRIALPVCCCFRSIVRFRLQLYTLHCKYTQNFIVLYFSDVNVVIINVLVFIFY